MGTKGLKFPKHSKFMMKNKYAWKDKPGIVAIHIRLVTKYGSAKKYKCVDCNAQAQHWSNEDGNKYSTNLKRYKPRCQKCHWKKDKHSEKMKGNKYAQKLVKPN